jgi:outer membrane protein
VRAAGEPARGRRKARLILDEEPGRLEGAEASGKKGEEEQSPAGHSRGFWTKERVRAQREAKPPPIIPCWTGAADPEDPKLVRVASNGVTVKSRTSSPIREKKSDPCPGVSGPLRRRGTLYALLGILAVAPAFGSAAAAEPPPAALTLADALRETAAHSQASVAAGLDLGAAREGTVRAKAAYWPSLTVSGGWQGRDHEIVAIFGTFEAPTTQKNFFTAGADLIQILWDGGRRSAALAASRRSEAATELKGKLDVQAAELGGLGAYLEVLVLKAQRQVVDQRIASLEEHLRIAQDLYDQGIVARNDLLGTQVRLRVVKDQVGQIENGIAVATQTLSRLMGRSPDESLTLPEVLPSPPPLPDGLSGLKQRAAEDNPRLTALRARLAVELSVVAARKGESWPSLFAQASHTYQENQFLAYPNANTLFVGVSWQAWENGSRKAAVRQAEIAVEKTRSEIGDLARGVEIDVGQAFRDFTQALREAGTARSNVEAAEENLRIEEDQYKSGLARTIDVLDAESTLAESRFSLVNQHYTAYLKEGILAAAAGFDLPTVFADAAPAEEER